MLATFVIGLREGLEAALIVGIIAAFLRRNGKSLVPMWIGVVLAAVLAVAVGVGLHMLERGLPQSRQEALETIIGLVAIFFVMGMIVWMNGHARQMKFDLEEEAALALRRGGAYSLAIMAFLAVLKEGFETSVFLLATLSAAQSAKTAAIGAMLGIAVAAVFGWGIYVGGVRLNLSKFFRYTGAFLVLVAAGLVVSMLRTAHEAGWLNAGQQRTLDLSWLVQRGTVRSALITGVLGIPPDPRLIEVLGWFAFLIPVTLFVYWPNARRPKGAQGAWVQFGTAIALGLTALLLAFGYPRPSASEQMPLNLVTISDTAPQQTGTAELLRQNGAQIVSISLDGETPRTIVLDPDASTVQFRDGVDASAWVITETQVQDETAQTITLEELIALAGGRVPIGFDPKTQPGPFTIERSTVLTDTVWVAHGLLIDANEASKTIATLSDGGLDAPRTITVKGSAAGGWDVSDDDVQRVAAEANVLMVKERERHFWADLLPIALAISAVLFGIAGYRTLRRHRAVPVEMARSNPRSYSSNAPVLVAAHDSPTRSDTHAVR